MYFKSVPMEQPFNIHYISQINYDVHGNLWVCSQDGLFRFNGYNFQEFQEDASEEFGLVRKKVRRSHVDLEGNIWFAGEFSVYRYQAQFGQLERMTDSLRNHYSTLYFISYFDIDDYKEEMIFATKAGLQFYDKRTNKVTEYDSLFSELITDSRSTNAHVLQIERDPMDAKKRWLLTRGGLIHYDLEKRSSEIIKSPERIKFKYMNELGNSICVLGSSVYVLTNSLNVNKYDIETDSWIEVPQIVDQEKPYHMRNIRIWDGNVLLVYINHDLHVYDPVKHSTKAIRTINSVDTEKQSISRMGVDHSGALSYIHKNRRVVRSVEPIYPSARISKEVFYENFRINFLPIDTLNLFKALKLKLKRHQRDLHFSIGLTNRNLDLSERYFYKTKINEDWIEVDSRHIELSDLKSSTSAIYTKITTKEASIEGRPLQLDISRFFYEKRSFWILIGVLFISIASLFSYLFVKRKQEVHSFQQQLLELEMDRLRSQMNPHFLFNSMNSIKNYLVSRNKEEAADYITDFSKLIRMILENSRKKFLKLEEEIEMLQLYVAMENNRLNGTIDFSLEIDKEISHDFLVAPMLIQPYLENAIWHGLMNKKEDRKLKLQLSLLKDGVQCLIRDNGVGRKFLASKQKGEKLSKKSLGTRITGDRIKMINRIYNIENEISIIDLYDRDNNAIGTEVKIFLPFIEAKNYNESNYS